MLRSITRDATFTPALLELAGELHAAGLSREWQPGDRLLGGGPPVRVVRSVAVDGAPLVEVERAGRVQMVAVARPRVWLPLISDILGLLDEQGCEGALSFRAEQYLLRYRATAGDPEYRHVLGDDPLWVCYRAMLDLCSQGLGPAPAETRPV